MSFEWLSSGFQYSFDWNVVLAYAFGVGLLYLVARILFVPLKVIVRLLVNAGIGIVLLLFFNFVGGYFQLYVPINPVTAVVAGFMGIPGIILLLALQYVILR